DALMEESVGADDDADAALGDRLHCTAACARGLRTSDQRDVEPERPEPALEISPVLLGEQLGRRHERGLEMLAGSVGSTGADSTCRCNGRYHGLTASDVPLDEAHHWYVRAQIRFDF